MADERLKIIIDAQDNASDDLKRIEQGLDNIEKEAGQTSGKLGEFGDLIKGPLVAAVGAFAVGAVAKAGVELFNLGIDSKRAELALIAYAGSATQATLWTEEMGEAAGGALNEMELMEAGAKFAAGGLANTAEEAAHLTEIAINLGAAVGKGPTESIEELGLLLQNESILRLDSFGVAGTRVKERMEGLRGGVDGVTEGVTFMDAFMAEAEIKLGQLEEAGFEATTSVDKLSTHFENFKIEAGQVLADGVLPLIDGLIAQHDADLELATQTAQSVGTFETYRKILFESGEATAYINTEFFNLIKQQEEIDAAILRSGPQWDSWMGQMEGAAGAAGDVADEVERSAVKIIKLTEADLGRQALVDLGKAFEEKRIPIEDYHEAFDIVTQDFLDMPAAESEALWAIQELRDEFNQNATPDALDLVDALGQLLQRLEDLKAFGGGISIPINVLEPSLGVTYNSPTQPDYSTGYGAGGGIIYGGK